MYDVTFFDIDDNIICNDFRIKYSFDSIFDAMCFMEIAPSNCVKIKLNNEYYYSNDWFLNNCSN